ncbi:MAG: HD domain-containing phosphohydrolase, partial [Candidatus Sedimenticola sp. 20ELBAFRAG]
AIATKLGCDRDRIHGIRMGAQIHDIGNSYVPAEILSRPGPLTGPEFEIVKHHSEVGHEIIHNVDFEWPIAEMILQHHERLDGSGYPAGLGGDEIILEARILAVADTVVAMTSHRPYRSAFDIQSALEEIKTYRGQRYDEQVVDACVVLFEQDGYRLPD